MATEHSGLLDHSIPQWKRELILRRRAVGRVLPAGSGSVQLTCPSVVAAVRHPEHSLSADFHLRRCASEREQTGGYKNMRLLEQVNSSADLVDPGLVPDIKELMTKIESGSIKHFSKMGEEKNNANKKSATSPNVDKKSAGEFLEEEQLSDSSEEFKYGPGIVSRLKSRYLSLTLRESQNKARPSLANLRRATSLENILDGPEVEKADEAKPKYVKNVQTINGSSPQRCRGISRGNKDSMKRARSVEALMRYDRATTNVVNHNRRSLDSKVDEIESEEKRKVRNRLSGSSLEEKELPPPDVVKQTLKIFESSSSVKKIVSPVNKVTSVPKGDNSISANKPVISPKPVVTGKIRQNGARISPDIELVKNKLCEKSMRSKSIEIISKEATSPEKKLPVNRVKSSPDRGRGAAILKEKTNESVIAKKPLNEVQPSSSESIFDTTDTAEKNKPILIGNNSPPKDGLTLDLYETSSNKQKPSPKSGTSPKSYSDKKSAEPESPCPSSISPVLVRAPPRILSTELSTNTSNLINSPNSPISQTQHMKQVGVIRPIVTNKTHHSNSTFPSKYPVNKPHSVLTEREIEKNLINKVKSIEQPVTKVIVSLKKSPEECIVGNVNVDNSKQNDDSKKAQVWDKKPNSMVFNFSNRTTVPDYIENDGLILAPRKEKPKVSS